MVDPEADFDQLVERLRATHDLIEVSEVEARPTGRHEFGLLVRGRTYRIRLHPDLVPDDVYGALDVNLLQHHVLGPIFGITDPRDDSRLSYIPDRPGLDAHGHCDAWFLPFPPTVADVMAVADAGLTMPPKSTWFAPKVPSGLVVRLMDEGT